MAQSTFDRHMAAIKAGKVDKTNIFGLRKAINRAERLRAGWSVSRGSISPEQADALELAIEAHQPTVIGELHETGLRVLRNPRYAKRLAPVANIIGAPDVAFRLTRFDRIGRRGEYAVPVYRVTAKEGSFIFRNIPWQSGGDGPELV